MYLVPFVTSESSTIGRDDPSRHSQHVLFRHVDARPGVIERQRSQNGAIRVTAVHRQGVGMCVDGVAQVELPPRTVFQLVTHPGNDAIYRHLNATT